MHTLLGRITKIRLINFLEVPIKMKNKLTLEFLHSALEEDSLQHHGIKNMHWGVKNGPPYPLDKKVSAWIKKGKN